MSLHSSLKATQQGKGGTQRSVLKRFERIRTLLSQGRWTAEQSIFGLPKLKQLKIKARKAAPKEAAAAEAGAAAPAAEAQTSGKAAAPAAKAAAPSGKPSSKPSK